MTIMFDVYPDKYPELLDQKVTRLKELFNNWSIPDIDILDSPTQHFRMRAEFRIWHTGDEINYAMFEKKTDTNSNTKSEKTVKREPITIKSFPRADKAISDLMHPLLQAIEKIETLNKRLFQMDFLCSLSGEMLVTLIYHKKLDEEWLKAAAALQTQFSIKLIGRARKQKEVISEDFILEKLTVNDKQLSYQQVENSFTQPNAVICEKMLTWAVNNTKHCQKDLLELYCGNGNFTLALAQNFNRVLATEVSKTSVRSALYNMDLNNIENIDIVRMSSEEITQALNKEREFRRLKEINLDDYEFSTLFVDPPRAGLDEETLKLASRFDNIIYISCNPNSLVENLKQLKDYRIKKIALFDQFPYTDHMECGVILQKC